MGLLPIQGLDGNSGASWLNPRDPEFRLDFLTTIHRGVDEPYLHPRERRGAFQAKAAKDLVQAGMLLAVLRERRGAELQALWQNLLGRGPGWRERAEQGALALQRQYPGLGIQGLLQV